MTPEFAMLLVLAVGYIIPIRKHYQVWCECQDLKYQNERLKQSNIQLKKDNIELLELLR